MMEGDSSRSRCFSIDYRHRYKDGTVHFVCVSLPFCLQALPIFWTVAMPSDQLLIPQPFHSLAQVAAYTLRSKAPFSLHTRARWRYPCSDDIQVDRRWSAVTSGFTSIIRTRFSCPILSVQKPPALAVIICFIVLPPVSTDGGQTWNLSFPGGPTRRCCCCGS